MVAQPHASTSSASASDVFPDRKFVRITEERADGFIAFDFAISEPDLFVEMLLTRPAFEEFCRDQNAILLETPGGDAWRWRLSGAATAGFKFQ